MRVPCFAPSFTVFMRGRVELTTLAGRRAPEGVARTKTSCLRRKPATWEPGSGPIRSAWYAKNSSQLEANGARSVLTYGASATSAGSRSWTRPCTRTIQALYWTTSSRPKLKLKPLGHRYFGYTSQLPLWEFFLTLLSHVSTQAPSTKSKRKSDDADLDMAERVYYLSFSYDASLSESAHAISVARDPFVCSTAHGRKSNK